MKPFDNPSRVCRPVQEIRITECNVLGSFLHLLPYVCQDDIAGNNSEGSVVYRDNRAVTTKVLTPATCLRVPGDSPACRGYQFRVPA